MRMRSVTGFARGFAQACAVAAVGRAGYNSALSRLKGTRGIRASGSEETREEARQYRQEDCQAGSEGDGEEIGHEEACGQARLGEEGREEAGRQGGEESRGEEADGQAGREACEEAGRQ